MRIDFKGTPRTLLALLLAACSSLAAPDDLAAPPGDDPSRLAPDPANDDSRILRRPPPPGASCSASGQTLPSGGRCNRCTCDDGSIPCSAPLDPFCADRGAGTDAGAGIETDAGTGEGPGAAPDAGPDPVTCDGAGQSFPTGSDIPSGDDCNTCACDEGSITCTERACDPVFCASFVEAPDGICARFPLDPCMSQDPDCLGAAGATEP